ncbi:lambda-exonuclease family protein [Aquabacterium sp.]|uniref:YqaJ viral recombinase family nuclease n=1 Tax=Aquabacterium sp. TaxID=1872578 RepID=UPI00260865F9|nr:YqaJ viral recombinase family protein [Aquabacterium sp.]MDD2978271.1 YqaJ viral recombinase family protein [Aquabacterium sp.]
MNAPERAEFLARRRAGIGGSDISAVLGLNPYKTGLQLWMEKTGRSTDEPDASAVERMHWGTVLEDVVARHYADLRGAKVQRINQQLQHPQCAIALANIDRAILENGKRARWSDEEHRVLGAVGVLECKTAHALAQNSAEWGEAGTDEVPQHYWMQCQWYLGITGLEAADLAVLFGGQKFVTYTIRRDAEIFADMLHEADSWWKRYVVADVPPQPSTEEDARMLWKSHVAGREKIVDANTATAVEELKAIKDQIKAFEAKEKILRDCVAIQFGDAEAISYMGRRLATWKQNKASSKTDWKAAFEDLYGKVPDDLILPIRDTHTKTIEGARVLRIATSKE